MKNVLKITMILIILLVGFGSVSRVYADPPKESIEKSKEVYYKNKKEAQGGTASGSIDTEWWKPDVDESGDGYFKKKVGVILGVIKAIGILVSVGVLMIIGIRNMVASAEEKSILREAMPGYILGLIMVAGMTIIPSVIYDWINGS